MVIKEAMRKGIHDFGFGLLSKERGKEANEEKTITKQLVARAQLMQSTLNWGFGRYCDAPTCIT